MKRLILVGLFGIFIIVGGIYLPAGSQPIPTSFDPMAVHVNDTLTGDVTATFESDGSTATTVTDLTITSEAQGDVLYFNGTNWVRLAKGSAGQVLEMNSGATAPEWDTDDSGGSTAWDDIGDPDANDVIDFGAYVTQLDVNDLRIGAVDSGNYMKIAGNAVTFVGTGDIDLPDDSVDSADIGTNQVGLDALNVSDVSDDIAGDIAEGELADAIIVDADIKDDTIQEPALNVTNSPTDNYVLTYNAAGTNFTWAQDQTGGTTAWDDIGDPDANDIIDFGAYTAALDVNDLRIGATDAGNYFKWDGGVMSSVGTTSIDTGTLTEGGIAVHNNDQMDASSELAAIIDDETGTAGYIVFSDSPTFQNTTILERYSDTAASGPIITMRRGRAGAANVADGDEIAEILFRGLHSSTYSDVGGIKAVLDDTPGKYYIPSYINIWIQPKTGVADGNLEITLDPDGTFDIGDSDDKLTTVIHDAGTIQIYDANDNTSVTIGPVSDGTTTLGITGTVNATALQEGGNAVWNSTETDIINDTHINWGSGANQVDLADIPGGTAGANAFNFGGATSVEIPNAESADGTLTALGQLHIRGDEDRLSAHVGAGGEVAGEVTKSFLEMVHISVDPGAWYDSDSQICLFKVNSKKFPNGIIIDYWEVNCLLDPDVEMDLNLGYANGWDDIADPNLIDVLDTTAGVSSEDTDANINGGSAVAASNVLFLYFDADPEGTCVQMIFEMIYHAEED